MRDEVSPTTIAAATAAAPGAAVTPEVVSHALVDSAPAIIKVPHSTPMATAKIDDTVATRSFVPAASASPASSVSPMRPSAPGTRSQNPGRNDARAGIAGGWRPTR